METSACLYEYKSFIVLNQKSIREEGVAGDIPCTYDSLDFSESGREAFEALSTPGVISSAEPNVKHTDEPLQQLIQQPIQDRISSNKVPNIDGPRRSRNVGRLHKELD